MEKVKEFFTREDVKKVLGITKTVLLWTLVAISVGIMIFTMVSVKFFNNRDTDIFGYKAFIVLSDSMSSENGDTSKGHFNAGDLVISKQVDPDELEVGDIITFISQNPESMDEIVTHMIKEKIVENGITTGFVTYGTATGTVDSVVVESPFVVGEYKFRIPALGTFFNFLKTTPGYIVCILIPFLLLIGMQGINSVRLFKKYKAEEMAELEEARLAEQEALAAERAAIAEERKKQEEMMKKLLEMQEAMEAKNKAEKPEE